MTIHVVSNTSELNSALSQASGGDTIQLRAGDYGDLSLNKLKFSSEVTITAHDEEPPTFNTVQVWESENITFDGLDFDFVPTAETMEWNSAFRADWSSNISVTNSTFTGGNAVAGIDPDSEPGAQGGNGITGFPIGVGLIFNNNTGITIENNTISDFTSGVRFSGTDGVAMNYNEIFNVRKVPVGGGDVDNVHMEGNYFHDLTPWKFGGLGDHGDFVHFWTRPNQDGPSENLSFVGNFFAEGDGVPVLGIYLDDNTNDIGFSNVLVQDNVIHNGNAQGLRMEDVVGLRVIDNTFVQSSGDPTDAPQVYLHDGNRDVLIEGNIFAGVNGPGLTDLEENNITLTNNMVVQVHDPLADNYVGDLFVNGLTTSPDLSDLSPVPGSTVEGYGANIVEVPEVIINDARGEGLLIATHDFELAIDQPGQVAWDFGDGHVGNGLSIQHTYATAGTYEATATVRFEDGTVHQQVKTIEVLNVVGAQADFDEGLPEGVTAHGDVNLVAGQNGNAIQLGNTESTLSFEATEALRDNPEFSISMAFQKEPGQEGGGGRLLHFSGTAVIDLSGSGISLRSVTDAGERIVLRVNDVGLDNSEWHQITYTMSQAEGSAVLYVDGVEVARMDGLEGAQHSTPGHNLHLGNPFGNSFTGLMDEPAFLRGAMTPEQVEESYEAFVNGEAMFGAPEPLPEGSLSNAIELSIPIIPLEDTTPMQSFEMSASHEVPEQIAVQEILEEIAAIQPESGTVHIASANGDGFSADPARYGDRAFSEPDSQAFSEIAAIAAQVQEAHQEGFTGARECGVSANSLSNAQSNTNKPQSVPDSFENMLATANHDSFFA